MPETSEEVAARLAAWGNESRQVFGDVREPARLAAAVVTLHRRVDEAMAASLRGHGVTLACERGCGHCCHLRVEVQPAEAFHLAEWLRKRLDAAALDALVARLRENARRTRELGAEARKRTSLACALLGPDGACQAYEARPAQCRRYHATDVAPCKAFREDPTREELESAMHPAVAHNAAVIIAQARQALREAGLREEAEDLNLALLAALENPKAWRRWKDGKAPFVGAAAR